MSRVVVISLHENIRRQLVFSAAAQTIATETKVLENTEGYEDDSFQLEELSAESSVTPLPEKAPSWSRRL